MSNDSPLAKLEGMLCWIRMRPQNYCRTLGELDTLLHFLHEVWAKFAAREAEYETVLGSPRKSQLGELSDAERNHIVGTGNLHERAIIDYWTEIDARLGIVYREEVFWHDAVRGGIIDGDAEDLAD